MQSTSGSTELHDSQLARRLPPALLAEVHQYYAQLQALQAQKAEAKQRGKHAGKVRASTVRRAILAMAEARALQLSQWTESQTSKCEWIQRQIATAIEHNNGNYHGITRTPHVRTIFKVINGLRM